MFAAKVGWEKDAREDGRVTQPDFECPYCGVYAGALSGRSKIAA